MRGFARVSVAVPVARPAATRKNTDEIVEFFEAGKGFFSVVRVVGTVAKWVTTVAAALVVMWALAKYGVSSAIEDMRK